MDHLRQIYRAAVAFTCAGLAVSLVSKVLFYLSFRQFPFWRPAVFFSLPTFALTVLAVPMLCAGVGLFVALTVMKKRTELYGSVNGGNPDR